jgi:hypothetical protein
MYWNIKTSSTIFTACPEALTSRFESWAARNLVRFQIVTASLDPEVLQWPGGSLIASLLWLCVMARSFWSVGTVARLHLRAAQAGSLRIERQSGWQRRQSPDRLISDHLRFACHVISVLPGSTAMTILVPGPGKIEPAESPLSHISRLLAQIWGPGEVRDTLHRGRWRSSSRSPGGRIHATQGSYVLVVLRSRYHQVVGAPGEPHI